MSCPRQTAGRTPQVLLNTRAKRTDEGAWVTCSGEPLAGDVVYQTVGGTANTGFLKGSGVPTDARGFIQVCLLSLTLTTV